MHTKTGDFNIDLVKYDSHADTECFYEQLSSHGFRPLILQPSRITSHSATLIDNIFVNDLTSFSKGGNITCSISDHFLQFSQLDILSFSKFRNQSKKSLNWRIFNKNQFENELKNISWDEFFDPNVGTDAILKSFYYKIEQVLDEVAPWKRLSKYKMAFYKDLGSL